MARSELQAKNNQKTEDGETAGVTKTRKPPVRTVRIHTRVVIILLY